MAQVLEYRVEYRLPHCRNLLKQFDLEVGGPHITTRSETMEGFVVGDRGGEVAIENHHHHLPQLFHQTYATVVKYPFLD